MSGQSVIQGDLHHFGKRVLCNEHNVISKPRTLVWEWALLCSDSPFRKLLADLADSENSGWYSSLPKMNFFGAFPLSLLHGGKVARLSLLGPGDMTDLDFEEIGRVVGLCFWLGLCDLHSNNVVLGRDDSGRLVFGPVDVELVFDDVELLSHTHLISSHLLPVAQSGLAKVFASFKDCSAKRPAMALISGFTSSMHFLEGYAQQLYQSILGIPGIRQANVRLLLRRTRDYRKLLLGETKETDLDYPLLKCERDQLAAGDVPYFFSNLTDREVFYYATASYEPTLADVTDEIHNRVFRFRKCYPEQFGGRTNFSRAIKQSTAQLILRLSEFLSDTMSYKFLHVAKVTRGSVKGWNVFHPEHGHFLVPDEPLGNSKVASEGIGISNRESNEILTIYRDWVGIVKQSKSIEASHRVVIDDLLLGQTNGLFPQQDETLEGIEKRLRTALANIPDTELEANPCDRYTKAKIMQSLVFLTQTKLGPTTRSEVIARGAPWMPISESVLSDVSDEVQQVYADVLSKHTKSELEAYFNTPLPSNRLRDAYLRKFQDWLPTFNGSLPYLRVDAFHVVLTKAQAPWRNRVTNDEFGFTLTLNVADHHTYSEAQVEAYVLHEIFGHIGHLLRLQRVLKNIPNSSHLGVIAIHTQDAFLAEGVAQFIARELTSARHDSPLAKLALFQFEGHFMLRHIGIMNLISGEATVESAARSHLQWQEQLFPWIHSASSSQANLKYIENLYTNLISDPFLSAQTLNYSSSLISLLPILKLPRPLRQEFGRNITAGLWSPEGIEKLVRDYSGEA